MNSIWMHSKSERLVQSDAPPKAEICAHTLFEKQAASMPDAIAVDFDEEQLTYRALDQRANQLARLLQQKGVKPDARVGIFMERSVDFIVAVLGTLKAGGCYVPLDPAYPEARLAVMLEEARMAVLLTHSHMAGVLPPHDATTLCLDEIPAAPAEERAEPVVSDVTPDHLAYVLFTSGSTGRPKGVAMPHRPLVNLITWQQDRSALGVGDRTLQFSALSFDVSFQEIFATLSIGGCLVLVPEHVRQDTVALLHWIRDKRVQRLFLPFVALQHLTEIAAAQDLYPPALQEVITAGEQLKTVPSVVRFFQKLPDCSLENQYGPTESHVVTAYRLPDDPEEWETLPPIGQPIANATIHLLDDTFSPVPDGDVGELYIGGVSLARGYLDQPERTAERFLADPFSTESGARLYHTGDLARRRPDGHIEFLGRADRQVKVRGYRIELGEVEAALNHHASVQEAVVRVDENGPQDSKRLAAYVVPHEDAAPSAADLRAHLAERLPEYMVPAAYVTMDAFPLTPSGKVDRKALPAPDRSRAMLKTEYVSPRDELEETLVAMWEDALGFTPVGIRDDFFDLGGHSILAAELFVAIGDRFGRDLPLALLAENPTVEALAEVLRGEESATWHELISIQPRGEKTPFFCIHGGGGNVVSFRRLAQQLGPDQPLYGLQWGGMDGSRGQTSIDAMATDYLAAIREVQPEGPYLLGGHCVGGLVAREIARRLEADGQQIAFLAMSDTPNIRAESFVLRTRVDVYCRRARRLLQALKARVALRTRLAVHGAFLTGREVAPDVRAAYEKMEDYAAPLRRFWQTVFINACRLFGKEVPPSLRKLHAGLAMTKAVHAYEPKPFGGPTLLITTGRKRFEEVRGRFTDERLGWTEEFVEPESFSHHAVACGHSEVVYHPEPVRLLKDHLNAAHCRIAGEVAALPLNEPVLKY